MDSSGVAVEHILAPNKDENTASYTQTDGPDIEASSSTIPSSPLPKDAQLFSDNALLDTDSDLSSPPSSPPVPVPLSTLPAHKVAFSFLKRKRSVPSEHGPLTVIEHNARKVPGSMKRAGLKQMQIDLGGEIRKTCEDCGMEYIPSVSQDAALHKDFHNLNKKGVDVGKILMRDAGTRLILPKGKQLKGDEAIIIVDRRSSLGSRNKVKKILEVVNSELSATEIDDAHLWGSVAPTSRVISTRKSRSEGADKGSARFKAFVYLVGDRSVGLCLIEKLSSANRVVDPSDVQAEEKNDPAHAHSSSILVSDKQDVALLGVSRIWTSRSHRRQGIAETLLDCARRHFFYGMEVTKDLIAFSQPTDSGGKLARQWFGAHSGWHVYRDKE